VTQCLPRLTLAALRAAGANRHPPPGCIHHSDRGAQYAAEPYRRALVEYHLAGPMSRRGNPYDNGQAESFMKTLKCEEVSEVFARSDSPKSAEHDGLNGGAR
jgi:putative transposase